MPVIQHLHARVVHTFEDFALIANQWRNPTDVLSILSIIGGDIVQGALAQLASASPRPFTPVAFSFGWVAYAFSAILATIGPRRLAPDPDCSCTLIEVDSGYSREVRSWPLARLVRDYDFPGREAPQGLTMSFYRTSPDKSMGVPDRDWIYYNGLIVIILQLGIAVIPGVLSGVWTILVLTAAGLVLVQLQAALPQWREELWKAREIQEGKHEVVCLTRGNGSAFSMVIRSDGCGLRLADLAAGREVRSPMTAPATVVLAVLWLVHLFCVQAVQDDTWYLLAIGGLGMAQNALAAGTRRTPGALGFHLIKVDEVQRDKVFETILEAERIEKKSGIWLTDIYFPGGLRPHEEQWKQEKMTQYARKL